MEQSLDKERKGYINTNDVRVAVETIGEDWTDIEVCVPPCRSLALLTFGPCAPTADQ